jgi:hypothetical protein
MILVDFKPISLSVPFLFAEKLHLPPYTVIQYIYILNI